LLTVFQGRNLHLLSKVLSKGALVIESIILGNLRELFLGGKQVITCRFNPRSGYELHRCYAKKFNEPTMQFPMI